MAARLLVVDDDPEICSALVRGLALHGYAAEAETRAEWALERALSGDFAGAIIDVMLGEHSGIDLVKTLRQRGATMPLVMLSALSEVQDRAAGLAAGADDYIVKPFSFEELVARLQVQQLRSQADKAQAARFDPLRKTLSLGAAQVELTDREAELLLFLGQNAGTPMARGTIFDAVWASDGSTSENVVDVYIGYLRKKLADQSFGFSIKTVRHRGFMLDGVAPEVLFGA